MTMRRRVGIMAVESQESPSMHLVPYCSVCVYQGNVSSSSFLAILQNCTATSFFLCHQSHFRSSLDKLRNFSWIGYKRPWEFHSWVSSICSEPMFTSWNCSVFACDEVGFWGIQACSQEQLGKELPLFISHQFLCHWMYSKSCNTMFYYRKKKKQQKLMALWANT